MRRLGSGRRTRALGLAIATAGLLAGCGTEVIDTSARYFPKSPPTASAVLPLDGPSAAITLATPSGQGQVEQPRRWATPGAIAITNVNQVCRLPVRSHVHIPAPQQSLVYRRYGLSYPQTAYALDFLVPLALGGAAVPSNIWPMSTSRASYQEKQQLNVRLRTQVCAGAISLSSAQHQIEADWYSLWVLYGR